MPLPLTLAQATQPGFNLNETIDALARTPLSTVLYWTIAFSVFRIFAHKPLMEVFQLPAHKRLAGQGRGWKFLDETLDALIYTGIFVFMLLRPFVFQTFNVPSGSMVSTIGIGDYIVANKAIYRYSDPKPGDIVVFRPPFVAAHSDQVDASGEVKVDFVKRCIGVPGDVIELRNHVLYRNGQKWNEPYKHLTAPERLGEDANYHDRTPDEIARLDPESFKLVLYHGEPWVVKYSGTVVNEEGPANTGDPAGTWAKLHVMDPFKLNSEQEKEVLALPPMKIPANKYLMFGDNRLYSEDGRAWGLVPREDIVGRSEAIWMPITHASRTPSDAGSPAN